LLNNLLSYFAHGSEAVTDLFTSDDGLAAQTSSLALRVVVTAAIVLMLLTILAAFINDRNPKLKLPIFILMAITMAGSTLVLIGSTVYLNISSDSGGPVHWHAAIEYWACGNQLEFRDPEGKFSNKIGTSTSHEHDDKILHLEGVIVDKETDASLGGLMNSLGAYISSSELIIPLNDNPGSWFEDSHEGIIANQAFVAPYIENLQEIGTVAEFQDGQSCGDEEADVQVYVFKYNGENDVYWQEKLTAPESYIINEEPNIPPGDCLVIEFGPTKERTDKLCSQYGLRDVNRCEEFGVEPDKRAICTMREVGFVTDDDLIIELKDLQNSEPAEIQELEGLEDADD